MEQENSLFHFVKQLQQTPLFYNVEAGRLLDLLEGRYSLESYVAGTCVYDLHDFRRAAGIVLAGCLRVSTTADVLLNTIQPGQMFGVASLFNENETYVSQVTAEKKSLVMFLSAAQLEAIFQEEFSICRNFLSFLSGRIIFLNQKISGFAATTPRAALLVFLTSQASASETYEFFLPCSRLQLSKRLNMSRATFYRALDALKADGTLIENANGSLSLQSGLPSGISQIKKINGRR